MVDVDARDIGVASLSAVVGDNGGEGTRCRALIRAAGSSSASGVVAEQGMSLDSIRNWRRVCHNGAVERRLCSVLSGLWCVGRRDVNDSNFDVKRRDDPRAGLRFLPTVRVTDGAPIRGAVIAEMAEQSAVIALVVTVFFAGDVRGIELAIEQVGILFGPFQIAA